MKLKGRSCLGCVVLVIAGMILAGVGLYFLASYLVFQNDGLTRPNCTDADMESLISAQGKIGTVLEKLHTAESTEVWEKTEFTAGELNALLTMAIGNNSILLNQIDSKQGFDLRQFWGVVKPDSLLIHYLQDTPVHSPFGSKILLTAEIVPEIEDHQLKLQILDAKAGRISVVREIGKKIDSAMDPDDKTLSELLLAVRKLEFKHGSVEMEYNPYQLNQLMIKHAANVLQSRSVRQKVQ